MKNSKRRQKARLFDPDVISTKVQQALSRDFESFTQMYKGNDSITRDAFTRQRDTLLKKYVSPDANQDHLTAEAFEKFKGINSHMLDYNIKHSLATVDDAPCFKGDDRLTKVHKRVKSLLLFVLGNLDEEELFVQCKNSAGTSLGVSYSDTSQDAKFSYPMSCTESAKPLFDRYLSFDYQLNDAIEDLNSHMAFATKYDIVQGSRATTVEKTSTQRRFIAIEPTCNMFLQQGLMRVLYERMEKVGLDVTSLPEKHKKLARESSITCKNATIDWSSASDCVSIELLRLVLPARWFALICQVRCNTTTLNGEVVELQMVSSMGNAGTFPIETLIFWAYAICTIKTSKNISPSRIPDIRDFDEVSVFGDDCIVPTLFASDFIDVMTQVGFIVNKEKSFYENEQFRESCGGDYLSGYDNRPFSLKGPTSTKMSALEPWLYIIINSLLKKYFMYFGEVNYVYDKALYHYVFGLFRLHKINVKLVPSDFPDDSGLKVSSDIIRLAREYGVVFSPISRSHHGTLSFNYCSFKYRKKRTLHDAVRYAIGLKKPVAYDVKPFLKGVIRKRGGYTVAKAFTAHWTVPDFRVLQ